MNDSAPNPYDEIPYPSYAFAQSHPDSLATLASLFGMSPTPPAQARVLEVGCASGGNLIPMAALHPGASFLGFDLSQRQVDEANRQAAQLGLTNIRFECRNILDPTEDLGTFDYIITHGVFSWVPKVVQEGIFALCRAHLSPQGVAYISYNTFPGWQLHGVARELMMYFAEDEETPLARVARARGWLELLARSVPQGNAAYHGMLNQLVQTLEGHNNAYVLHEFLEEVNEPTRFVDFMERAHGHGLQYLGESGLTPMLDQFYAPEVSKKLREWSSNIFELEQYMDFLRARTFRQTLLVHQSVELQRDLTTFHPQDMWLSSQATVKAAPEKIDNIEGAIFRTERENVEITLYDPLAKALMLELTDCWPETIPFEEAFQRALTRVWPGDDRPTDPEWLAHARKQLGVGLLSCFTIDLVEMNANRLPCVSTVSESPEVWRYTRHIANTSSRLTNVRHQTVDVDPFDQQLAILTDGTRTAEDLFQHFESIAIEHEAITGLPHPDRPTRERVAERLEQFAAWGLLVS